VEIRVKEAEPHLRRTVALLYPAQPRDRAAWLCDLAMARVGAGAVDEGCRTANEAASVIRRLDSAHDRRLLADFRRAAAPYASSTAVREFDAKHHDLISSLRVTTGELKVNPNDQWG